MAEKVKMSTCLLSDSHNGSKNDHLVNVGNNHRQGFVT